MIADTSKLEGTVRLFNSKIGLLMPKIIERIAKSTARTYRADAVLNYTACVPPTVNDPTCTKRAVETIRKIAGESALFEIPPTTGAEDFAIYTEKVPGVFVILGVGNRLKGANYP